MKFWSGQLAKVKLNIFETLRFTQVKEKKKPGKKQKLRIGRTTLS